MKESTNPLSWEELSTYCEPEPDFINGANNPYALKRLFGQDESSVRVTLFRDNHAWCPYCQKVWLWLEWKEVPYKVKKATMRCYGTKEDWYLKIVPSGIFPAISLDGRIITESDQILLSLEKTFGSLGKPLEDQEIITLRILERKLFRAWCMWLCSPSFMKSQETSRRKAFQLIAKEMEEKLSQKTSPWLDPVFIDENRSHPGSADIIFIPYVERMNASLAYYKGMNLRKEFPKINEWLSALEQLDVYRGTQGDFHTHAHDLPPQMGGCWAEKNPTQKHFSEQIDLGEGLKEQETTYIHSDRYSSEAIALNRVLKHRQNIMNANPLGSKEFDQPLRSALSTMILKKVFIPNQGSAAGLRYLKDRISVPRDMPLISARVFRKALEKTAQIDGMDHSTPIPINNRKDQNPIQFQ